MGLSSQPPLKNVYDASAKWLEFLIVISFIYYCMCTCVGGGGTMSTCHSVPWSHRVVLWCVSLLPPLHGFKKLNSVVRLAFTFYVLVFTKTQSGRFIKIMDESIPEQSLQSFSLFYDFLVTNTWVTWPSCHTCLVPASEHFMVKTQGLEQSKYLPSSWHNVKLLFVAVSSIKIHL